MSLADIQSISGLVRPEGNITLPSAEKAGAGEGFSKYLSNSLNEVNQLLIDSDKKSVEMVSGKSENLHEAMISFEKAESALKLLVQVRNKAIEAYHEVMRMQV